jgi:hypothetical protein
MLSAKSHYNFTETTGYFSPKVRLLKNLWHLDKGINIFRRDNGNGYVNKNVSGLPQGQWHQTLDKSVLQPRTE